MRYFLVTLLAVVAAPHVLGQDKPASIPVVKTWQELQELPPIDLGDGVKIRLGMEANKLPQWSGGLIYCLTEGFVPPSEGSGEPPFGPVHASVSFGDRDEKVKEIIKRIDWLGGKWPKGQYLFVRAHAVDRAGKYSARITDSKGKLLAEAALEGTKDFFHPWMPWLQGYDKRETPWESGIALPTMPDISPLAFIEQAKKKEGKLPTLLPSDEKPSLTIKMDGEEIVIRAETEFTTSRPDYHFLARWWVNGKPFVPKQSEALWRFDGYGRVSEGKELRLDFRFHPERLGAKPGDKIGLQLMHAEGQWAWCADADHTKFGAAMRKDGESVRVSNRIDFVAPMARKGDACRDPFQIQWQQKGEAHAAARSF